MRIAKSVCNVSSHPCPFCPTVAAADDCILEFLEVVGHLLKPPVDNLVGKVN